MSREQNALLRVVARGRTTTEESPRSRASRRNHENLTRTCWLIGGPENDQRGDFWGLRVQFRIGLRVFLDGTEVRSVCRHRVGHLRRTSPAGVRRNGVPNEWMTEREFVYFSHFAPNVIFRIPHECASHICAHICAAGDRRQFIVPRVGVIPQIAGDSRKGIRIATPTLGSER